MDLRNVMQTVQTVVSMVGNAHYGQVYFDPDRAIRETSAAAGLSAPGQRARVRCQG